MTSNMPYPLRNTSPGLISLDCEMSMPVWFARALLMYASLGGISKAFAILVERRLKLLSRLL